MSDTKYAADKQRDILRKCGLGGRLMTSDESYLMEWGWCYWTPVIEKLLERIEALEKRASEDDMRR